MRILFFVAGFFLFSSLPSYAGFPFSFGKREIKTDYSQTVWDRMMQEQSFLEMRRGMGEMAVADYQAASNSFARAVVKNTKDPMGYLLLGASLYWSGKVDDAVSEYKEALCLSPNNALAHQLLGIAAGWKGNLQEAQDYFLQANKLDPNKADTNMNLGSTYAAQQNWDKALDHFRRSVELSPRDPLYHYQLGSLYEKLGRDEQAELSFKKALKYFPDYEDAQLSLGALYEKLNRPQEALKMYKRAVKTKPSDFVARLRYALLLMQQGEEKLAREVLEQAFSITRFKQDGLALNAAYRASGTTPQAFEQQIEQFKDNLEKISPAKAINLEVTMTFSPVETPKGRSAKKGTTFEEAYQQLRPQTGFTEAASSTQTFQRTFAFQPSDTQTRQQQIDVFTEGLLEAVKQADEHHQVTLSMQGRTLDYNAPFALTQHRSSSPKAVYDPRIVGNDMGLWVTGKTWLLFVEEAAEILQEIEICPSGNLCNLLRGVAELSRGNNQAASGFFAQAAAQNQQDELPYLGLGTAAVIGAEDDSAQRYYQQALTLAPANKIARKNLKILTD